MTAAEMRLLVAVIHDATKLDEILTGFLDIGVTGATVLNSEGMGSHLSQEIPVFGGLHTLVSGSRPENRLILSVIPEDKVRAAVRLIQQATGGLDNPGSGIAFTLPVEAVFGLARELDREPPPED